MNSESNSGNVNTNSSTNSSLSSGCEAGGRGEGVEVGRGGEVGDSASGVVAEGVTTVKFPPALWVTLANKSGVNTSTRPLSFAPLSTESAPLARAESAEDIASIPNSLESG